MASSPLISLSGHNPLTDLLFSPRAAFIWNNTSETVTWMNAAARSRFKTSLPAFSNSLPAAAKAGFASCIHAAQSGADGIYFLELKLGRRRSAGWSAEMLELADGHEGLVVVEAESANIPFAPAEPAKPVAKLRAKPAKKRKPKKINKLPVESPRLTPEELQSLKAIGRTVRKLCAQKQRPAGNRPDPAPKTIQPARNHPAGEGLTGPDLLLSAFDLVLFLSEGLEITQCDGRPQRLGWRKSSLQHLPAASLLPASERAVFYRMVKKLESGAAQICCETLMVCDEAGNISPCRAILGRYQEEGEVFFALLSLKMPQRLKRFQPHILSMQNISRLAA